jgi:tetratricopeptide (TPR) repeat protein
MSAESRARQARERALREGNAGRTAAGIRHARAGLEYLGWDEDGEQPDARPVAQAHRPLAARLLGLVGMWEAQLGRTGYGLSLLDRAEKLAPPGDRAVLLSQRGTVYLHTGREQDAVAVLGEAVAELAGKPGEAVNLARTLLNRSSVYLSLVQVNRARADLDWCSRIATEGGHDLLAAMALHNLGYCDLLAGDIPAALRLFDAAAGAVRLSAPRFLLVVATDKASALLAAGLASDAARELDEAIAWSRRQRVGPDLARAELARAQAALAAGELAAARQWASAAGRRFRQRGNHAWAGVAELTRLHARFPGSGSRAAIAAEAQGLAVRLRDCGLVHDADQAAMIAARALVAAGQPDPAGRILALPPRRGTGVPLAGRLLRRLARAELAEAQQRPAAALAELRAGLALVQDRRGRLGSIDLQTGVGALGADLATAGLRLALASGSAPAVFTWLERSRAQAFGVRPVHPPADSQAAAALAELRQLSFLIREAELAGTRDPALAGRQAELRREIREHDWKAAGLGDAGGPASLGEVRTALAESGQSLVGIVARPGAMAAVVTAGGPRGRTRLVPLGDFDVASEAARRLSADLDTLAGRRLPARLEAVIRESARYQAAALANEVIAPLRPYLGDGGVVLVPAGPLADVPWGALPGLRGRPVTVSPSASSWLAAWQRGHAEAGGSPLLVAGPGLEHAAREAISIAGCYPGCRPLLGEAATTRTVLRALDGAPLVHLAAHGHHDQENFLFSRVDLADGPLMAYDIQRLTAAPRHVILSSCDVGRTTVRPGEEILGFTAALLYIGTATVTASVIRVGDEAAVGTMTAYHRLLAAGTRPAEALAAATAGDPFSPFVCFGGG